MDNQIVKVVLIGGDQRALLAPWSELFKIDHYHPGNGSRIRQMLQKGAMDALLVLSRWQTAESKKLVADFQSANPKVRVIIWENGVPELAKAAPELLSDIIQRKMQEKAEKAKKEREAEEAALQLAERRRLEFEAEEARKAEEAKRVEEAKKAAEEARKAAEAKAAEEAKKAEEARKEDTSESSRWSEDEEAALCMVFDGGDGDVGDLLNSFYDMVGERKRTINAIERKIRVMRDTGKIKEIKEGILAGIGYIREGRPRPDTRIPLGRPGAYLTAPQLAKRVGQTIAWIEEQAERGNIRKNQIRGVAGYSLADAVRASDLLKEPKAPEDSSDAQTLAKVKAIVSSVELGLGTKENAFDIIANLLRK